MASSAIVVFLILLWGIATTLAGLYLSWFNNFKQNKRIIELLEKIAGETKEEKEK